MYSQSVSQAPSSSPRAEAKLPWYQRCKRWGQTNLTEKNAQDYDVEEWREIWRRYKTQGIIVNAGGIVAYYPSKFPHHYRAKFLGERDLFGEIVNAAREEGIAVVARLDSSRATYEFYKEHPDWFVKGKEGRPERAERYMACVNSPYFSEFIPELIREIGERYNPAGYTDNSWTGMGRKHICYCRHCRKGFHDFAGEDLPEAPNFDDPVYRAWITWSYECRLEVWKRNNAVAREVGGPDCVWMGMVNSDPIMGHVDFTDLEKIGAIAPALFCDQQSRTDACGFEQNSLAGKIFHEIAGWDAAIAESMALYVRAPSGFRLSSAPVPEARMWMVEGIAGGIRPWWHIVNSKLDDRRKSHTATELLEWHERQEDLLFNRTPIASAGILWSHENIDFFGRENPREHVLLPFRGWTRALTRARVPYLPVHTRRIRRQIGRLQTLILPAMMVLSDEEIAALHEFVEAGGNLIATGRPGTMTYCGAWRDQNAMSDLLGVEFVDGIPELDLEEAREKNTYLRLEPGFRQNPHLLKRLEDTDILAFGGCFTPIRKIADDAVTCLTTIPEVKSYPPEFSWMDVEKTDEPALVTRELSGGGRVAYLAADLDRCYARSGLPDHGQLLANLVHWTLRDRLPVRVEGPGYLDIQLYAQEGRQILHIANLSGANQWPAYFEENYPVGPLTIYPGPECALEPGETLQAKVSGQEQRVEEKEGKTAIILPQVTEHELLTWETV